VRRDGKEFPVAETDSLFVTYAESLGFLRNDKGFTVVGESQSIFGEMAEAGVGIRKAGVAAPGSRWTAALFGRRAVKHGCKTDNHNFKRWSSAGGARLSNSSKETIRKIFFDGDSKPCHCGRCEPCGWREKLNQWFATPTAAITTSASLAPNPTPSAAATAVWESDPAKWWKSRWVDFRVHEVTGDNPSLVVTLSYSKAETRLDATDDLPAMRVEMTPTQIDIQLALGEGAELASKSYSEALENPRVSFGNFLFSINNKGTNDRIPFDKTRIASVAIEPDSDPAIDLDVRCPYNAWDPVLPDFPADAGETARRVMENVLKHYGVAADAVVVPLAGAGLRRRRPG
jgi:hypothetical protein